MKPATNGSRNSTKAEKRAWKISRAAFQLAVSVAAGHPLHADSTELRRQADRIVGIAQLPVIHAPPRDQSDFNLAIAASSQLPGVRFAKPRSATLQPYVLVAQEVLLTGEGDPWGWIDETGKPLLFWVRRDAGTAVVLLVDPRAVAESIDRWVAGWAASQFEPVRIGGGPDRLLGAGDQVLITEGEPTGTRPELILPLRTRFGSWQLASWDRVKWRVNYSMPTLAAAVGLAVLVATLGFVVARQQKQALAAAAQRV